MDTPTIHLLSVGINHYLSDKISNLGGCQKDVLRLQQTLLRLDKVSKSNCKMICNEEASRAGIINAFRTHFSQLQEGDIALFHYSGHGATESANDEFVQAGIEPPAGKNETLVCHDSKTSGIFNIADKELRLLVAEIQQKKKHTTFIAIFDCCHAGSMLKQDQWKTKTAGQSQDKRPLTSYLEGQFKQMIDDTGRIALPPINYIALTACSPKEYALEGDDGGLFTNAIIEIISQTRTLPSYAELHNLSRLIVKKQSENRQHPYLEYLGQLNPYQLFLTNTIAEKSNLPLLSKKDEDWVVNAGAIHGVEIPTSTSFSIPIFRKNDLEHPIGQAVVKDVFVEETTISPTWKNIPPSNTNDLCIGFYTKQLAVKLNVKDNTIYTQKDVEQLQHALKFQNRFLIDEQAEYEITIESNKVLLFRCQANSKQLLIGLEGKAPNVMDWLSHQLHIIQRWENVLQLSPPKRSKIPVESISFYFTHWHANGEKTTHIFGTTTEPTATIPQITIPLQQKTGPIFYQIEVEHQHAYLHGLYFYLVHLDRKYQINQKHESYINPLMRGIRSTLYNSCEMGKALGISDPSIFEVEDTFVLISSETPLSSPYSFHQSGFAKHFGKIISNQSIQKTKDDIDVGRSLESNWMIQKLIVRVVRE